jgi:DNA-binding winged helix-turn-helix (wHTH) protein
VRCRTTAGTVHARETGTQQSVPTFRSVDVVLVRWPAEAHRREQLVDEGRPRLLVVDGDADPPEPVDCLEDWVRAPPDEAELATRMRALSVRARWHLVPEQLAIDDDGVLRRGRTWVSLPPVEARLTAALLERMGTVVSREALARAGWPDGAPGRNALDVHVLRLRRRLGGVGLAIRTVRSRGYLLEVAASDTGQTSVALA